jgi:hypothetical protein
LRWRPWSIEKETLMKNRAVARISTKRDFIRAEKEGEINTHERTGGFSYTGTE